MLKITGSCERDCGHEGRAQSQRSWWIAVGLGASVVAASVGCGPEDEGVTYRRSVRPLFERRCTICHYTGGPIVDMESPFAAGTGLVDSNNPWAEGYPGVTPDRNVVPGDPDNSFLMDKIAPPSSGALPDDNRGGEYMPLNFPLLSEQEVAAIEQWVLDGANDDAFYRANVQPIFGDGSSNVNNYGKCSLCHYEGSPNPPNLINPFDPIDGVVNITASFRSDLMRVVPGNPDESFLVLKVRATEASGDIGATMPYAYPELTAEQVDTVEQWIREGALNN